jgi:acetoin utilization deacetylase AcuC-like enzyme
MFDHIKIYSSALGLAHDTRADHPEHAARLKVLHELIDSAPYNAIARSAPSAASDEDILRVHSRAHLSIITETAPCEDGAYEHIDHDTILSFGSLDAARHGAGAVIDAVQDIHAATCKVGLCINRPPGHHATHNQAMGFCIFNNVMIGAAKAAALGYKRIAIIDFDVHHGNGCADILNHVDLPCFYISTHQQGHYPNTGQSGENVDQKILNIPLPAGISAADICAEYTDKIFPALHEYKPDFVFISAGFDGHKDDPYGDFNLEEQDYHWLSQEIYKIAQEHAEGRMVSVLEGGYALDALKGSYAAHIDAFQ